MTSRKFLLYNSEDDLVDLNNHEIFVLNPTGLGVSFSNSFSNVSANFLQEKSVLNSASLKLDIIFSRNSTTPYEKYEEFVKFLNKPPFKLIYEISGKTFQRDCVLSELSKGEIVTNVLSESLTLDFTTPLRVYSAFGNNRTSPSSPTCLISSAVLRSDCSGASISSG